MSAVRPELGPTLPELVARRSARPQRVLRLAAAAAITLLVAILAPLILRGGGLDGREKVIHRGPPVFNVLYEPGAVRRATPRGAGQLLRFEGGEGRVRLVFAAHRVSLPPFRGDVNGILPVVAQRLLIDPRRDAPGFRMTDEGRARVNDAPGYQVGFRLLEGRRRVVGRDVIVMPAERGDRRGILLSFRQTVTGDAPLGEAERDAVAAVRSAFRSFRYGTERK